MKLVAVSKVLSVFENIRMEELKRKHKKHDMNVVAILSFGIKNKIDVEILEDLVEMDIEVISDNSILIVKTEDENIHGKNIQHLLHFPDAEIYVINQATY